MHAEGAQRRVDRYSGPRKQYLSQDLINVISGHLTQNLLNHAGTDGH